MSRAPVIITVVSCSPCSILHNIALSYITILSEVISYAAEKQRSAVKAFNTREVNRCWRFKRGCQLTGVQYKSSSLHGSEMITTFVQKLDMWKSSLFRLQPIQSPLQFHLSFTHLLPMQKWGNEPFYQATATPLYVWYESMYAEEMLSGWIKKNRHGACFIKVFTGWLSIGLDIFYTLFQCSDLQGRCSCPNAYLVSCDLRWCEVLRKLFWIHGIKTVMILTNIVRPVSLQGLHAG